MRTRSGASTRRSRRWAARASSIRGGSRSRRARTTSSATRGSAAPIAPIRVATGEHVQNRVVFKQLFQARGDRRLPDRRLPVGGVNEVLAILLMAAKFGVPVCPHAGGVGLCEYVQHLAVFDYVSVSCSLEDRVVEWVDHLHEHFRHPAVVDRRPLPRAARPRLQHRDAARRRSRSTRSRTARPGRAPRRVAGGDEVAGAVRAAGVAGVAAASRLDALPAAAGRARRAPRRPGADPADPRGRGQPDDAGLLHEPEHRQRLLADRRDRRPRAGAAARDRQPRHRPLGRLDGRALGRRRRDRLHARPLDGARRPRDPRHRARGRARERPRLRRRPRPAPVHRHARQSQHRPRARALGSRRHADPGHARAGRHPRRRHDRLAPVLLLRRRSALALAGARRCTTYLVWGRWLYAVGGNPDAARRIGHPVGRVLDHRLRAQRPRRRRRRPPHRRASSTPARRPPATSRSSTRSPR